MVVFFILPCFEIGVSYGDCSARRVTNIIGGIFTPSKAPNSSLEPPSKCELPVCYYVDTKNVFTKVTGVLLLLYGRKR